MLNMILWLTWTFSTEKLNQNLETKRKLGFKERNERNKKMQTCIQDLSQKVDEVDGEDGPHAIVGESFTGLHPNDKENPPENHWKKCLFTLL